ncbi:MAG: TAXI family TRAP transporter solute-binding subunit [Planctomycetota bacterium]
MTKQPERTGRRNRSQRTMVWVWVGVGALTLAFFLLLGSLVGPSPPKRITLAGGLPGGAYHAFADRYREVLAEQGLEVEVRQTAGSIENLELLERGDVDVAFVQSGTRDRAADPDRLRGIASLYYEPLWIFHRGEETVDDLGQLRGKRLAIGGPRSGTFAVCDQLLALNGIDASNTRLEQIGLKAAREALKGGEIDYAFFTASPDAEVVRELMVDPETRLVGIRRHKAYVRNVLFVTDVEIAEGTFDIRQNFPRDDITVLSTVAQLLTTEDLHPAIAELLARTAEELHSGRTLLARGGTFPTASNLEFAVHEAAADYFRSGPSLLARYLPFWLANLLKKLLVLLIPLLTLMIPLLKIAPGLYKAVMRKRIHRWYDDLDEVEEQIAAASTEEQFGACAERLQNLEHLVETGIQVPTTFRHEEYDLRVHLAHVRAQLDRKRTT